MGLTWELVWLDPNLCPLDELQFFFFFFFATFTLALVFGPSVFLNVDQIIILVCFMYRQMNVN